MLYIIFSWWWWIVIHKSHFYYQLPNRTHITELGEPTSISYIPQCSHSQHTSLQVCRNVLIGSLLGALREQLHLQFGVSNDLACIMGGVGCDQEPITIATTGVLSFGCNMQNPVYGYCSLGPLSSLNLQIERPLPTIQLDHEAMAIHSDDKLIMKDLLKRGPHMV